MNRGVINSAAQILKEKGVSEFVKEVVYYTTVRRTKKNRRIFNREHIQILKEREGLTIAEVGVWKGKHAKLLLETLDIEELFLIDPYRSYDEYNAPSSENMSVAEKEARERLSQYSNLNWVKEDSQKAVEKIDAELDYVYIDGNHDYGYVKQDMESYYPLLTDEGILAGHDLVGADNGVSRAFVEFSVENNLHPQSERFCSDWYFIKEDHVDEWKGGDLCSEHGVNKEQKNTVT